MNATESVSTALLLTLGITSNGVTNTPASATYSYSSGVAHWIWDSSHHFGFLSKFGSNVSCSIVHN